MRQMIEKTHPTPEVALLDWKGLRGNQRKKILGFLDELEMEFTKI